MTSVTPGSRRARAGEDAAQGRQEVRNGDAPSPVDEPVNGSGDCGGVLRPAYSVLMSVYVKDRPVFLDEAVRSMVEQTVPFTDMVLVCDGPLNQELDAVIDHWQSRLGERLRVHRLPVNGGLARALREGLPLCRCEVVARMDSDDIARPGRCELQLTTLIEGDLDLVGGCIAEFDQSPGDMGSVRDVPLDAEDIRAFARSRNPFNHMTVMFRRRAVEAAGGYRDVHLLEDYDLWVRMIMKGCRCANVPEVVVDARTGEGMYSRRSSLAYLRAQRGFFRHLREVGFISRSQEKRAVLARAAAAALPAGLVKRSYNLLLRRR